MLLRKLYACSRIDFKFKKREKGSKAKKYANKLRDQIIWKQVADTTQGLLYNGKAFAIPILTASGLYILDNIAVRIGIANALEFFHSIATLELYLQPVFTLFDP